MIALFVAFALSSATADGSARDLDAARNWVGLVDTRRWDESWTDAGALFKSLTSEARWASLIEPVREPLGAVESRSLRSSTHSTTLPGMPDGDYEVVQFQTKFAHKADAVEIVVLAREGGSWKVEGYFIR